MTPWAGDLNASKIHSDTTAGLDSVYNGVKGSNNAFFYNKGDSATEEEDTKSLDTMGYNVADNNTKCNKAADQHHLHGLALLLLLSAMLFLAWTYTLSSLMMRSMSSIPAMVWSHQSLRH